MTTKSPPPPRHKVKADTRVVLVGGPCSGKLVNVGLLPPQTLRMPIPDNTPPWLIDNTPPQTGCFRQALYQRATLNLYTFTHFPMLNHLGRVTVYIPSYGLHPPPILSATAAQVWMQAFGTQP